MRSGRPSGLSAVGNMGVSGYLIANLYFSAMLFEVSVVCVGSIIMLIVMKLLNFMHDSSEQDLSLWSTTLITRPSQGMR